ncbi:hypothetical protein [Clostridium butyricum]
MQQEIFAAIVKDGSSFNVHLINLFFDFLYAYIPYKLWYTFNIKDKCEIPNLNDIKGILRYIYIIFLDSITVTLLSKLSIGLVEKSSINLKIVLLEFFNNYNFQAIIGVLILIIFSTTEIRPHIPKTKSTVLKNMHYEYLLYFSSFFGIYGIVLQQSDLSLSKNIEVITILLISYALMILFIVTPIINKGNTIEISKIKGAFSIKGKVTIGLLIFVIIFIGLLYILGYVSLNNYIDSERCSQVYIIIGIASYFIFAVALLALKYVRIQLQFLFRFYLTWLRDLQKVTMKKLLIKRI